MALPTLTRFRGDTFPITRTLTANGAAFDLTGATAIVMSLSAQRTDGTILGPITGVITDALSGAVTFDITSLDLPVGEFYWDVQVTNATGITTVEVGKLTIDADLTV